MVRIRLGAPDFSISYSREQAIGGLASNHPAITRRNYAKQDAPKMTDEEKIALKAARLQAAATLISTDQNQGERYRIEETAKLARKLFAEVVQTSWP